MVWMGFTCILQTNIVLDCRFWTLMNLSDELYQTNIYIIMDSWNQFPVATRMILKYIEATLKLYQKQKSFQHSLILFGRYINP